MLDLAAMPDMVATLAAIGPFALSPTRIRGALHSPSRERPSARDRHRGREARRKGKRDRRRNRDRAVEAPSRNDRQLGRPSHRDELRNRRVEALRRANPESGVCLQDLPRFLREAGRARFLI